MDSFAAQRSIYIDAINNTYAAYDLSRHLMAWLEMMK